MLFLQDFIVSNLKTIVINAKTNNILRGWNSCDFASTICIDLGKVQFYEINVGDPIALLLIIFAWCLEYLQWITILTPSNGKKITLERK